MKNKTDECDEWIRKIKAVITDKGKDSDTRFHELIYNAPDTNPQIVVDTIFSTFLHPFDSSVMQACITVLSGYPLEIYTASYVKILPLLLETEKTWAIDLFDYPGKELSPADVKKIETKILERHDGQQILHDLKSEIIYQQLDQDEPWSFLTA
ncbi:hypothetical protein [Pseudomonas sp. MN1F]|uniref:hypothetical protein n=1 Tax=Pseudomonas sp. MN1F TaxID=1366632 RepID=UPI00128EA533|nr:hypothetical protein [Pseudomonas sp. MN1F]MQG94756.1 hypothetical protein [Pseudomonas sp. MN1F]